jgi:hypothetical protein
MPALLLCADFARLILCPLCASFESRSVEKAREEVTSLLRQLKLPLYESGSRRVATGPNGSTKVDKPLEVHDILGA